MEPIDYRNATFESLQERLSKSRAQVLEAWQQHGPGSTEELAERSGISILSLRPRTTELYQLGFVVLADAQAANTTGASYRAAEPWEIQAHFNRKQRLARECQTELELGV
ncbi:hypothetical protein [Cerasicoccus maritimus]|uniref:hypothetical protein n=1 Tax=Cerasicoccus maritimus TaxID=490089 RepID=UPI002852AED9|nr:hypothetical protein [Cerasicoccus maritimus]